MGQFLHNNVVRLHGVVTEEENMMIVLEYMPKGDLRDILLKLQMKYELSHTYINTVLIQIEARVFISYKWLLTRCLYEPLLHLTLAFISFRVLNSVIYISPASIWINTIHGICIKFLFL